MRKEKVVMKLQTGESYPLQFNSNEEESLWKKVAETFYEAGFKVPNNIQVLSADGKKEALVEIEVDDRSNAKEDTIRIRLVHDTFDLEKSVYETKHLRHINAEKNIRARYDMNPNNMGPRTLSVGAIAGEIGRKGFDRLEDGMVYAPYPSQLYWLRYYEKLHAGYKDYTEALALEDDEDEVKNYFKEPEVPELADDPASELYRFFAESAKATLRASGVDIGFYSNESPYTRRQTASARAIYTKMFNANTPDEINRLMDDVIAIASPTYQRGTTVRSFYVKEVKDPEEQRQRILEKLNWVNELVSSMEAVVSFQHNDAKVKEYKSAFGDIAVRKETEEEMKETIKMLNPRQAEKVVAVYVVTPTEQKERYEERLEKLHKKKEHRLFHGSPNCNWISIIQNGLLLHPNAEICGKAFGIGTYFAPDSDKSAGYGSQSGSYWRGGSEEVAAMGIYRVGTGRTYDPKGRIIGGAPKDTEELLAMFEEKKYDSLWYHAGSADLFEMKWSSMTNPISA